MTCPDCGANLDQMAVGDPCPNCGSHRRDATVSPPTVEARAEVLPPTISAEVLWDGVSLTLAGILLGIVAAVGGVFVAGNSLVVETSYAASVLVLAYLVLFRFRFRVIRWVRRWVARS
jgi:hypothetical protein